MFAGSRHQTAAMIAAAAGLAASAHAQVVDPDLLLSRPIHSAERHGDAVQATIDLPTPKGTMRLDVKDITAPRSVAAYHNDPAGREIVLTSTIIAPGTDQAKLAQDLGRAMIATRNHTQFDILPAEQAPRGYLLAEMGSVRVAVEALRALRAQGGYDKAGLDYIPARARQAVGIPNDPFIEGQFHLNNPTEPPFNGPDLKVFPVWERGYTGAGVVVGIRDADSYSYDETHFDLAPNHRAGLSQFRDIPYFNPLQWLHATEVAGVVAAAANGQGGAGIAYNAGIARLRNGTASELTTSLTHMIDDIDITVNAWGSPAEELREENVFDFVVDAFEEAVTNGRNGLGQIYITSAGNQSFLAGVAAGQDPAFFPELPMDNPPPPVTPDVEHNNLFLPAFAYTTWAFDEEFGFTTRQPGQGYAPVGSITDGPTYSTLTVWPDNEYFELGRPDYDELKSRRESIVVSALDEFGQPLWYAATGNSVDCVLLGQNLEVPFLDAWPQNFGDPNPQTTRGIVTTTPLGGYAGIMEGTSAAAAQMGGIVALMLEANPLLTTRDIRNIIRETADPVFFNADVPDPDVLEFDPSYTLNAANIPHSVRFGFGLINADDMVAAAETWEPLGEPLVLDTGVVSPGADGGVEIGDAVYEDQEDTGDATIQLQRFTTSVETFCVSKNIQIEEVEVTLDIDGSPIGDLLIEMYSPAGTRTVIAWPRYDTGAFVGPEESRGYQNSRFLNLKYWGELTGGNWNIEISDVVPDDEPAEPPEAPEPDEEEPEVEIVRVDFTNSFGIIGPMLGAGGEDPETKTWVSYRVRFYGKDVGAKDFRCDVLNGGRCAGDLDGNGVINFSDVLIFTQLLAARDPAADVNEDMQWNADDLFAFLNLIQLGPCRGVYDGGVVDPTPDPIGTPGNPIIVGNGVGVGDG